MASSFEVLATKSLPAEVGAMEWCPTMDLLALVSVDSQLFVHRGTQGWQRLFKESDFDHPITCVAWRPDGQVLAVGHSDGSTTLLGVEQGEPLGSSREQHSSALTMLRWVPANEPAEEASASPYACSLSGLFAPLPMLPREGGSAQQYLMEEGSPQLDIALHKLLFESPNPLAFDISMSIDDGARIHLAVHG